MSDPQVLVAAVTAVGGIIASVLAWFGGRRKGSAEAAESQARAEVALSTEARALATDLRAELAVERSDRRRLEDEVEKLRGDLAAERRRCEDLTRRVAELERLVRGAGLHVPGDTPAGDAREGV